MTPQQKDILIQKMFDTPQSLSQEEIQMILSDKELLDLYQTAVLYKDSKPSDISIDMDKEWESISGRLGLEPEGKKSDVASLESSLTSPDSSNESSNSLSLLTLGFWTKRQWRKYAAIIAVCISLTAIAAITTHYVVNQNREFRQVEQIEDLPTQTSQDLVETEESTVTPAPAFLQEEKIFEATTLAQIAQELSLAFGTTIEVEDNVKGVRLYLRLPQGSSIEDLLTILGQYESLSVQYDNNDNIHIGHGE